VRYATRAKDAPTNFHVTTLREIASNAKMNYR
jgi:hypothetical protein